MASEILAVGVAGFVCLAVVGVLRGWVHAALGALLLSLFVAPRVLMGSVPLDAVRVGITGFQPRLSTYTAAALVVFTSGLLSRVRPLHAGVVLPLYGYLLVMYFLWWNPTSEIDAGMVHFAAFVAAWCCGAYLAGLGRRLETPPALWWIFGIVALQTAVASAQHFGLEFIDPGNTNVEDATLVGRSSGTFSHPGQLGKVLFLCLILVLPNLHHHFNRVRRLAALTVAMAFVPLVLTGGRANAAAAIVCLILFVGLDPGAGRWVSRIRVTVFAGIGVAFSYQIWENRFLTGEDGSTRQHLNEVALRYLETGPIFFGTGPNTYITTVGPTDSLTASGWPVHNVFLLVVVEIGLVGALLFLWPFASLFLAAWSRRRVLGEPGAYARTALASGPGLLMILVTGWGMMGDLLIAWAFVFGYFLAMIRDRGGDPKTSGNSTPAPNMGFLDHSQRSRDRVSA